jgi:hypothetical protein
MSFNIGMSAGGRESFAVPSETLRKSGSPPMARTGAKSYTPIDVAPFLDPTCLGGTRNTSRPLNKTYFA